MIRTVLLLTTLIVYMPLACAQPFDDDLETPPLIARGHLDFEGFLPSALDEDKPIQSTSPLFSPRTPSPFKRLTCEEELEKLIPLPPAVVALCELNLVSEVSPPDEFEDCERVDFYTLVPMPVSTSDAPIALATEGFHLKNAADLGDIEAAYKYAELCRKRLIKDEDSRNEAKIYYEKAIGGGHLEARTGYARLMHRRIKPAPKSIPSSVDVSIGESATAATSGAVDEVGDLDSNPDWEPSLAVDAGSDPDWEPYQKRRRVYKKFSEDILGQARTKKFNSRLKARKEQDANFLYNLALSNLKAPHGNVHRSSSIRDDLKFAADLGHIEAAYKYAELCRKGHCIKDNAPNLMEAKHYYEKAMKGGHLKAQKLYTQLSVKLGAPGAPTTGKRKRDEGEEAHS